MISFGSPFTFYQPSQFPTSNSTINSSYVVAPYWSDVDNRKAGQIRYQVFEATNRDSNASISRVNGFISQAVNETFNGLWMLVAEWRDVHPYPHAATNETDPEFPYVNQVCIIACSYKITDLLSSCLLIHTQTNTFQGLIATDGISSYAVFTYNCNLLTWSGQTQHAVIGYNMRGQFLNHPLSATSQVVNVSCANSPNSPWSNLVYSIGTTQNELQRARANCARRYANDVLQFGNISARFELTLPCPCCIFQAESDRRFRFDRDRSVFEDPFILCYTQRFPLSLPEGGGQLCCYTHR